MKKVSLLFVLLAGATLSYAQKNDNKLALSVGANVNIPLGDFGKSYSYGVGLDGQLDYFVQEKLAITGSVGFTSFNGKSINVLGTPFKNPTITIIPVLVGGKYLLTENLYAGLQLGVGLGKVKKGDSFSAFAYAPSLGYKINENVDVSVKYQGLKEKDADLNSFGLRVAYTF
jgi:hypothetical protein